MFGILSNFKTKSELSEADAVLFHRNYRNLLIFIN